MKKLLFVFVAVFLLAIPTLATTAPRGVMSAETFLRANQLHGPAYSGRSVFEGFEAGVPPAGWTSQVVSPNTWTALSPLFDNPGGLEGNYVMSITWDSVNEQDEWVAFDQLVDVAGGEYVLSFWTAGDFDSGWAEFAAETVEINDEVVWDFDSVSSVSYAWEQFFIDLSEYDGQVVNIKFHYAGFNANSHYFDAVMVDAGTGWQPPPPPPAPLNDTCLGAVENGFFIDPGEFYHESNTVSAAADYQLSGASDCAGYSFDGRDVVWVVCMEPGDVLDVSMVRQFPFIEMLFLVTDCADPENTCVAGAGDPAQFVYTATEAGIYYLICGGHGASDAGAFYIEGTYTGHACDPDLTAAPGLPNSVARLEPARPNPFNPVTEIRYTLPEAGAMALEVYDLNGRQVKVLYSGMQGEGTHRTIWNGSDTRGRQVSSGIYFVRLLTERGALDLQKLTLLK